eukprot:SAG22_NODE_1569_length_4097_cov_2.299400_4_plen_136_part_00
MAAPPLPPLPSMPPLPPLSAAELRSFVADGYLVKRGALDPRLCARVVDAFWEANTSAVLRREDPASWAGPVPADDESTADLMNFRAGWQWRLRGLCSTPDVLDLFPRRCGRHVAAMPCTLVPPGNTVDLCLSGAF